MNRIIAARECPAQEVAAIVGGKGANLMRLVEAGAPVPGFLLLASPCFDAFIASFRGEFDEHLRRLDCSTPSTIAATAGALRECMKRHPLNADLAADLASRMKELAPNGGFFSVRSSALGEDSKEFSYAGMLDTYLFCKSHEEICRGVVSCWASIYSDRAVAYRHMRKLDQGGISMCVVVQLMVDSQVSGVTFTVNPTTKYVDEILITSVFGLGEGLVSGSVDSDQFVVLKQNDYPVVDRQIAQKADRVVLDREKGSGTKEEALSPEEAGRTSLTDAQLKQVAEVCHRIEKNYGTPQDIEWGIDADGSLKILQARPITTIDRPWPSERAFTTLWDNSNIVESYSGVTTPLTFSFALHAYHMVYVQFCEVLGVPTRDIQRHDFAFANMLGLLHGRIYYNLKNWYRLISVLPGYKYNSRFMEGMMGVKATFDLDLDDKKNLSWFERYFFELPKVVWSGFNLGWKFWKIDSEVETFMDLYKKMYAKYEKFDFNAAPAGRIVEIYNELEYTVLRNWKAPIINDFMAMIFYGILRSLMTAWNLDADGTLQNDLCAGQGNVESTLPMRSLQRMARFIATNPALQQQFKTTDAAKLKDLYAAEPTDGMTPEQRELCAKVTEYLREYGYRAMNELKLEEPSLNEKPEFLFVMLKNYLVGKLPAEEDTGEAEVAKRQAAEQKVRQALAGQKLYGFIPKIDVLEFVLNYAKKAMAFREYQRFARTKMYGLVRRMFLGIGHRFTERNLIDRPDDIFYLTTTDVISYVVGTATSQKLRELAAIRKAEFAGYQAMEELPDRIETKGVVYVNDLSKSPLAAQMPDDPNLLKGIGACSGIVRKKVKVILNPSDDMSLNGEILVAARTDPGWVPLFASASALLIERGSMLSHSVIVARELGLPAVVGVTGATKRLKTGDEVELDGSTGIIRILSRAEDAK